MLTFRDLWLRVRALAAPRRVERELDEELAFHVEMETHRQLAAGLSAAEARRRARARFGPMATVADACRDIRGIDFLDTCGRDVGYAFRSFRRTPIVAATVVGTIALGLGLSAAVFTIFNAFVFRSDRVSDPGSLYRYSRSTLAGERRQIMLREYESLRRESGVFADVAARRFDLETRIDGRMAAYQLVTGNFFQMLGVGAALGRTLTPADAIAPGREPVVVLSHQSWQRLFAGDPAVVGRTVLVKGFPYVVVGVAAEGFHGLDGFPPDFWAPLTMAGQLDRAWQSLENPGGLDVIGRLKPGMSAATARAGLAVWTAAAGPDLDRDERRLDITLDPAGTAAPLSLRSVLMFSPLFLAFGLILLIACANVASLMLARSVARQREIAIRLSLGASRRRVVRQLVTESLLLALAAAACGLLVSRAAVDMILFFLFTTMPAEFVEFIRLVPFPTDLRVAGFLVVAAVVSTVVFGLVPALHATRSSLLQPSLAAKSGASFGLASRSRSTLIVVQVTASTLLLICAGIFLRSAERAAAVDPGIRVSDTVIIDNAFDERLRPAIVSALSADPIVASVVAASPGAPILSTPRDGLASAFASATADKSASSGAVAGEPAGAAAPSAATYRFVSSEYFDVLGIDVLNGRVFTSEEAASRAAVAVVSEAAARQFWPGGNAVGQWLRVTPNNRFPSQDDPPVPSPAVLILGVVRDVTGYARTGNSSDHTGIYLPVTPMVTETTLIVRAHGDPEIARRALADRLTAIDPTVGQLVTMRTLGALRTYPLRVAFWVTVVLGALALVLTLSGIYGVLSYMVVQRTKEIGVRIALGATAGAVTRQVLWQSLRLVACGLAVGAGLALAASTALARVLPVEGPFSGTIDLFDGIAYAGSLLTILTACVLAASYPALRAARIDPIATLRHD